MFRRFPAAALVVLATLVLASCARIPPGVCSQFKTGALDMTALGDVANTKFLADFDARPDVAKTASGLRYRVLASGTGAQPRATDTVRAHYRGTLIDCTVFDSSYERGPATFPVNRLIPGWVEALQLMHVGDVWELVLPYQLAYGEAGAGADIPPRQTLVFQLELLEVK